MVGHGLENLIEGALGPDRIAEGVRVFRDRYRQVSLAKSRLLPGVAATVRELGIEPAVSDHYTIGGLVETVVRVLSHP